MKTDYEGKGDVISVHNLNEIELLRKQLKEKDELIKISRKTSEDFDKTKSQLINLQVFFLFYSMRLLKIWLDFERKQF